MGKENALLLRSELGYLSTQEAVVACGIWWFNHILERRFGHVDGLLSQMVVYMKEL